jgi:hypothetical protein
VQFTGNDAGIRPVSLGGTGASTAAGARSNLGISAAMDPVVTALTLALARSAFMSGAAMDPVVNAATLAAARSAMGPWGDALVTATGSVTARSLAARFGEVVNVLDYGADATGSADSKDAFDAAVTACPAYGVVYFPNLGGSVYKIASAVTVAKNISVVMAPGAYFNYTGGAGTRFILFSQPLQRALLDFQVVRSTDWTVGSVGVELLDCVDSVLNLGANGFRFGIYLHSSGSGQIAENTGTLKRIWDNQYGVYLHTGVGGSLNANTFFGGRWSCDTNANPTLDRYGLYFNSAGTTKFIGGTIEIFPGSAGGIAYTSAFVNNSKWNRIIDPYIEQGDWILWAQNDARDNRIIGHISGPASVSVYSKVYEDPNMTYPGTNGVDWTTAANVSLSKLVVQDVFRTSNIHRRAIANSNSGGGVSRYMVPGWTWCAPNSTHQIQTAEGANLYLTESALVIDDRALGRCIDTTITKRFWVGVEKLSPSEYANIVVKCWNAAGSLLSGGTHVKGRSQDLNTVRPFAADSNYGGCYLCDAPQDLTFFQVADTVTRIWVGVVARGTSLALAGMRICCEGNQSPPDGTPGYDLVSEGAYADRDTDNIYAIDQPVGGRFGNGVRVYDLAPASGAAQGWETVGRCTTTCNGGAGAGATTIPVASITGIQNSDVVGLLITNGGTITKWFWTQINGAPSGGNIVLLNQIPSGWSVANGAKIITYRWKSMGNLS